MDLISIEQKIVNAYEKFKLETDKKPTKIYLGWMEYQQLLNNCRLDNSFFGGTKFENRFRGIRVFEVREPEHIGIGI